MPCSLYRTRPTIIVPVEFNYYNASAAVLQDAPGPIQAQARAQEQAQAQEPLPAPVPTTATPSSGPTVVATHTPFYVNEGQPGKHGATHARRGGGRGRASRRGRGGRGHEHMNTDAYRRMAQAQVQAAAATRNSPVPIVNSCLSAV